MPARCGRASSAVFQFIGLAVCLLIPRATLSTATLTSQRSFRVVVNATRLMNTVSPHFISGNIDAAELWSGFNWTAPRLITLASHLVQAGPTYLRVGGGAANHIAYDSHFFNDRWPKIHKLVEESGLELVWDLTPDLASAKRLVDRTVKAGYHVAAFEYGNEPHASAGASAGRALGRQFASLDKLLNETYLSPNGPAHKLPKPLVWGPDVGLSCWQPAPTPGSTEAAFLAAFFQAASGHVDAATVHVYPLDHSDVGGPDTVLRSANGSGDRGGRMLQKDPKCRTWCNASRAMFPGPGELPDTLPVQDFALPFADIAEASSAPSRRMQQLVIGETAAVNHDGWANVTDSFVSGFWSLYQLGWVAKRFHTVLRQSFACSAIPTSSRRVCAYGLLDAHTLHPLPDYWSSLLWKRLVGTRVLDASAASLAPARGAAPAAAVEAPFPSTAGQKMPHAADGIVPPGLENVLRVYAHCTSRRSGRYPAGAVTLVVVNPQVADVELQLSWLSRRTPLLRGARRRTHGLLKIPDMFSRPRLRALGRDEYVLTSGDGRLSSREVRLNGGAVLRLQGGDALPPLLPRSKASADPVIIPALSYGFLVFPDAQESLCM